MSNTINTHHALAYFKCLLSVQTDELNRQEELFEQNKKKYESGLWFKIFKTPYEKSMASLDYDCWWNSHDIENIKNYIATCNYHIKCGDLQIHWEFRNARISGFYDWAEENNIPY